MDTERHVAGLLIMLSCVSVTLVAVGPRDAWGVPIGLAQLSIVMLI